MEQPNDPGTIPEAHTDAIELCVLKQTDIPPPPPEDPGSRVDAQPTIPTNIGPVKQTVPPESLAVDLFMQTDRVSRENALEDPPNTVIPPDKEEAYFTELHRREAARYITRWADIDRLPDPLFHYIFTGTWIRGHGKPTSSLAHLRRIYFVEAFLQGFVFIIKRSVQLLVLAFSITQLAQEQSLSNPLDVFRGNSESAFSSFFYELAGNSILRTVMSAVLATPFLWGCIQGLRMAMTADVDPTPEFERCLSIVVNEIDHAQASNQAFSGLWRDGIRWFLPLHPIDRALQTLMRFIRWDKRLSTLQRNRAFNALSDIFSSRGGYTRIVMGYHMATFANVMLDDDRPQATQQSDGSQRESGGELRSTGSNISSGSTMGDQTTTVTSSGESTDGTSASASPLPPALPPRPSVPIVIVPADDANGAANQVPRPPLQTSYSSLRRANTYMQRRRRISNPVVGAMLPSHIDQEDAETLYKLQMAALKRRAVDAVYDLAEWPGERYHKSPFSKKLSILALFLYGRYLQWWLGLAKTRTESIAFWIFKLVKNVAIVFLLRAVYGAIVEYLSCPEMEGIGFLGRTAYAGKFDQTCFEATIEHFNSFPGQPVSTLVGDIGRFNLPLFSTLNLSGKGLNGSTIAQIIEGFLNEGIVVRSLDLRSNHIGMHDHTDVHDTLVFAAALEKCESLTELLLDDNWIGARDSEETQGTVAVARAIGSLTRLQRLSLGTNEIGSSDDVDPQGTVALGEAMKTLPFLRHLNLSNNWIGRHDDSNREGTIALGEGLRYLANLRELDLSMQISQDGSNGIGYFDDVNAEGSLALWDGLSKLTSLEYLSLASNSIAQRDRTTAVGTVALGNTLGQLTNLRHLDLSNTWLGWGDEVDPTGTIAVSQGLANLTNLEYFSVAISCIGGGDYVNPEGTKAFAGAIAKWTNIHTLDLSLNLIGYGVNATAESIIALNNALGAIKDNPRLSVNLNANPVTRDTWALFQDTIPWLPTVFIEAADVDDFFSEMVTAFSFDFSGIVMLSPFQYSMDMVDRLFERLADVGVRVLMLTRNQIGYFDDIDSSVTVAIGRGLAKVQSLEYLDLSDQVGGYWGIGQHDEIDPSGTLELGKAIGTLPNLKSLILRGNNFGGVTVKTGALAFAAGLKNLTSIRYLDLSSNVIGLLDEHGAEATAAIGEALASMSDLEYLNLAKNSIGQHDDQDASGTVAIGQALKNLKKIRWLNLHSNSIGAHDAVNASGTLSIADGIAGLDALEVIDLSMNAIGSGTSVGEIAVMQSISSLENVCAMDVSSNFIGSTDDTAPAIVMDFVARLTRFNLGGMQRISWSESADTIYRITAERLRQACERKKCFGSEIPPFQPKQCSTPPVLTDDAVINDIVGPNTPHIF